MREQRIETLKAMLIENEHDEFALYGLALEYKATGRFEEALELLRRAAALEAPQIYTFYQLGEVSIALDELDEALDALSTGHQRAMSAGDMKAAREFQALIDTID